MFKHYIVTRFNLGLYRTGGRVPNEWFADRIVVFERFTLESLRKQTLQDFTLAVLVDAETPKKHCTRLNSLLSDPNTGGFRRIVVPIQLAEDWRPKRYGERWSSYIDYQPFIRIISGEARSILQTRLDNDDALLPCAVETLRRQATPMPHAFTVDYLKGYIIDLVNQKAYHAQHPEGTPFISLMQPVSPKMRCVYGFTHRALMGKFPCQKYMDRFWVMNVHGNNVSNKVYPWMAEQEISSRVFAKETGLW
jgi:N-acetylglucosaminyl-diphospho-decaprenol L-rhamnosyltransferase